MLRNLIQPSAREISIFFMVVPNHAILRLYLLTILIGVVVYHEMFFFSPVAKEVALEN